MGAAPSATNRQEGNMKNADYRKHNDRSHNSSTYHKKDGTPIRSILKREAEQEIAEELTEDILGDDYPGFCVNCGEEL